jgi:hypothetical protein
MDSEEFRKIEESNGGNQSIADGSEEGNLQKRPAQGARMIGISNPVLKNIDEEILNSFYGITSSDDDGKTNFQTEESRREACKFGRVEDTRQKPTLLTLPKEIRLMIYDTILDTRDIIVIEAAGQRERDGTHGPKTPAYGQLVGLLLTCEQISFELKHHIWRRRQDHVKIYHSFGPVNMKAKPYFIVRFPWRLNGNNFSSDEDGVWVDGDVPDESTEWGEPLDFYKVIDRARQLIKRRNGTSRLCNEFLIFEAKTSRDLLRMWVWKQVMKPKMSRREFNTKAKRFAERYSRVKDYLKETEKLKERCFGHRFESGIGWSYWYMHWPKGVGTFYGGPVTNSQPRRDPAGEWDESDIYRLFKPEAESRAVTFTNISFCVQMPILLEVHGVLGSINVKS